jgi:hypothetical protein
VQETPRLEAAGQRHVDEAALQDKGAPALEKPIVELVGPIGTFLLRENEKLRISNAEMVEQRLVDDALVKSYAAFNSMLVGGILEGVTHGLRRMYEAPEKMLVNGFLPLYL